ncbi:MAG: AAC(3) family N-acetyltransferase [Anaerolineaceae bacterium]
MLELTHEHLEKALYKLGIQSGDGLLVHSAIQMLGKPEGGIALYKQVIQKTIGARGTLVVPTFTLNYPITGRFDYRSTPSEGMGSFSEYIRQDPNARRSHHPLQSVAALGAAANDLISRDTLSAFETESVFERMLQLDFKLLLLGADVQAVSMVHFCETRAQVPYRQWKDFPGRTWKDGQWGEKTYRMYARILEIDPRLKLEPIKIELVRKGVWHDVDVNYGKVACCRLNDFVNAGDALLTIDPWILVENHNEAQAKLSRRVSK